MGQVSDPHEDDEDAQLGITISGLPQEPEDPPPDDDIDVDMSALGPEAAEEAVDDDVVDADVEDAVDESDDDEDEGEDEAGTESDEVAYDLSEWDDDQLSALADALEEAGIDHAWDEDELYVRAEDEQMVDGLLEDVLHPHALPEESDDGDAGGALLGELFVVADRLQHDPEEHEAVALLLRLATTAEESDPPYGLGEEDWDALRERVDALAQALEVDDPNLDEVIGAASELRSAIRPFV